MLKNTLNEFECFLQNHDTSIFKSFHPSFQNAFWEMLLNGGKRFRPSLLFSIVLAKKKERIKDSFNIALALEALHTYSLIHDDLPAMDNANLRRNHQTLHTKYSEADAILVGDALNSYSFYLIANSNFSSKKKVKLINSLGFGAVKMVLGQACDCYFEKQKLKKDKLIFIHTNKTAALIASSLQMGSIIANLPKKQDKQIYKFAKLLGIFFQIRDDILDSTSTLEGKTANNDTFKNSYVNLLGLDGAKNELEEIKAKLLRKIDKLDKDIKNNLSILLEKYF
ncbi:polyprenyl synthetase family protein [Helicobacter sp. MIT 14-3879]|uniref:polyprenyl synthetase family protein n=1 Tax=Helicobacter sp. MIT 14-3879 TaxID=2040649 RepID=UPI000E1F9A5F|nr:polyprenyl synthetase family protein [Helicobacter sp. MIT 14-3879]RDU64793.1 geranyl transferase [Helicobacter sp. MIT 14-3879]